MIAAIVLVGSITHSATALSAQAVAAETADSLYARRIDISSARRAVELWADALRRNPADYEAAWKTARADYWLGGHAPQSERTGLLEDGVARGRIAIGLEPNRPEGHFWTAANMGGLAEQSERAGLRYRRPIKEELETVLRLDRTFLQGSADRALGRWYFKVPRLMGGNKKTAEEHLRESLKYDSHSTASHFFLAELMIDSGRRDEARAELQQVLDAPRNPEWEPEDQDFKQKARELLQRLR